jgi:hypothetical protein
MPWTLEVQQAVVMGAPQILVDNEAIIDAMLEEWNQSHGWPDGGTTGTSSSGSSGGEGSTSVGDSMGESDGGGTGSDSDVERWSLPGEDAGLRVHNFARDDATLDARAARPARAAATSASVR